MQRGSGRHAGRVRQSNREYEIIEWIHEAIDRPAAGVVINPAAFEIVQFDNLVMIGVSLALILFAYTGLRIARWEGALLLTGYGVYVVAIWPA